MEIPAPETLKKPLVVPNKLLMGAGPANLSPRVLHAMSHGVLGHMHEETFKIMDEIKEGIKYVFQTKNETSLAISASGHTGMEAILCNILEPGDRVLIAVNGLWGLRAADMAERYELDHQLQIAISASMRPQWSYAVTTLNQTSTPCPFKGKYRDAMIPLLRRKTAKSLVIQGRRAVPIKMSTLPGDNFSFTEIEHNLKKYLPKLLFIVQGETSTGVHQPIEGLGDLCHKYNCLLGVDAVASVGGVPFYMDKWGVDAVYAGVQKAIGAPPGLTIISISNRALMHIYARNTPIKVYYWDMKVLGQQWNCYNNVRPYHHTTSSSLLCSLRESLSIIAEEGLTEWQRKHDECYQRLKKGIENLGLEFFVKDENKRLKTVTSVVVTDFDWKKLVNYAMNKYNVEIAGGLGPTAGKIIRIGIMGYNAKPQTIDFFLKVLKESLEHARRNDSKL